jgi:hypothetical protein
MQGGSSCETPTRFDKNNNLYPTELVFSSSYSISELCLEQSFGDFFDAFEDLISTVKRGWQNIGERGELTDRLGDL